MKATWLILPLVFLLISCSTKPPEEVLSEHFDKVLNKDYKGSYEDLSQIDKDYLSFDQYVEKSKIEGDDGFGIRPNIEIVSTKISGSLATSTVEIEVPILGKIQNEIDLIKEGRNWRILYKFEEQDKAVTLLSEAQEAQDNNDYDTAKEKYERALELNSDLIAAEMALSTIDQKKDKFEAEVKNNKDKAAYISNVELYDVQVQMFNTYFDNKEPGIRLKIKNKGNRTLSEVEVTVYYQDSEGTTIGEQRFFPVLVTEYSFGEDKPLKPNYIHDMGDSFYKLDEAPSSFVLSKTTARITDIGFMD